MPIFKTICVKCSEGKPDGEYSICHDNCGITGTKNEKYLKPQVDFLINNIVNSMFTKSFEIVNTIFVMVPD